MSAEDAEPFTLAEVQQLTRRSRATVARWIAKGALRVVKSPVTNRVYVPVSALAELARALTGDERASAAARK